MTTIQGRAYGRLSGVLVGFEHEVVFPSAILRPSTSYTLTSQYLDPARRPVAEAGVAVTWALEVTDAANTVVSTGTLTALTSSTNLYGQTYAVLTTGSSTGLYYRVTARTPA